MNGGYAQGNLEIDAGYCECDFCVGVALCRFYQCGERSLIRLGLGAESDFTKSCDCAGGGEFFVVGV